jgi:hypothetical protein
MTHRTEITPVELIRSNIAKYGHHIYLVAGEALPRFAYTIGVNSIAGAELVFAGASYYAAEEVKEIVNAVAACLRTQADWQKVSVRLDSLGSFCLRKAAAPWVNALLLGVLDFYGTKEASALQIVPDDDHWTVDIPDLTRPWSAAGEPIWRWLYDPWKYSVSQSAVATTNLSALRGDRITEAARWELDQWELFAGSGPDVPPDEVRVVPLATLLAIDDSLMAVTDLAIGQALWRDAEESVWHSWG